MATARSAWLVLLAACATDKRGATTGDNPAPPPADVEPAAAEPAPPPPTPGRTAMPTNPLPATWSIKRVGDKLDISYSIENTSDERYYVCDKLMVGAKPKTYRAFEGLAVSNHFSGDALLFILGTPDAEVTVPLPNTYVPLEPGAVHRGTRTLDLPLEAYNPNPVAEEPLDRDANQAYFMIFTFRGEPPKWKEYTGVDGSTLRAPEGEILEILRLGPEPLPEWRK